MLGYIQYGPGPRGPEIGERRILGGRFVSLQLGLARHEGSPLARQRAKRGARALGEAGVRRAVFPLDFPYTALFLRSGILPVDPLPLRRALAAGAARRRLESLGYTPTQAVVAVVGERVTAELGQTVRDLALRYRYVLLDAPDGAEELARSLRREVGAALLTSPAPEQLERADALLLFAPRGDLTGGNPVFYALYPGGQAGRGELPLKLPKAAAEQAEPNVSRDQLAAALYELGALHEEELLSEIPC
jgi:hypothetical protein